MEINYHKARLGVSELLTIFRYIARKHPHRQVILVGGVIIPIKTRWRDPFSSSSTCSSLPNRLTTKALKPSLWISSGSIFMLAPPSIYTGGLIFISLGTCSAGDYKRLLSKASHCCFQACSVGMGLELMVGNAAKIFHYRRQSQHWFKTNNCNTTNCNPFATGCRCQQYKTQPLNKQALRSPFQMRPRRVRWSGDTRSKHSM